jgi:hypothetical protein
MSFGMCVEGGFQERYISSDEGTDHAVSPFLCTERDDRSWGGGSFLCVCVRAWEIGETDDPLGFGVLPLRVTRHSDLHAGGRAAWRSSPPWRAEELGCQVGREWVRDRPHSPVPTRVQF